MRTSLIALVIGLILAYLRNQPTAWISWVTFTFWFSFGGHWVEIFFLNWLRPRLLSTRLAQVVGRLLVWIAGGTVLVTGARLTVLSLSSQPIHLLPWWLGGLVFLGLELLVHAVLFLRGHPNFYDGRG